MGGAMDSNQRFLLKSFRKYYRANTPILPDRFTRREFGFMFLTSPSCRGTLDSPTRTTCAGT